MQFDYGISRPPLQWIAPANSGTMEYGVVNSLVSILGLGMLMSPMLSYATTYYVDDSDTYSTTEAQSRSTPWATIQKAADDVDPGDTVIVGDGTYTNAGVVARFRRRHG